MVEKTTVSCSTKYLIKEFIFMDNESYMKPIDYEKWFTETNAFCDTGIMLKKFTPYSDVTELVMDLTDCLKDFFCTVRELVKT